VLMASRPRRVRREPHDLPDRELLGRVYRLARCAGSVLDPDDWFPVAQEAAKARDQAARAIAVCARCPVSPDCLELSLRQAAGAAPRHRRSAALICPAPHFRRRPPDEHPGAS